MQCLFDAIQTGVHVFVGLNFGEADFTLAGNHRIFIAGNFSVFKCFKNSLQGNLCALRGGENDHDKFVVSPVGNPVTFPQVILNFLDQFEQHLIRFFFFLLLQPQIQSVDRHQCQTQGQAIAFGDPQTLVDAIFDGVSIRHVTATVFRC